MITFANNYELVKLDESLIKGSGTDTDYDGAEDWDEVNVDLIYQLKPSLMGKKALLMNDMPTINEIIDYYDQAYVQSGLDRLTRDSLQYSSNPVKGVYRQSVAPIRSNPVDPDSDNDGVIDFYDSKPLDNDVMKLKSDVTVNGKKIDPDEMEKSIFYYVVDYGTVKPELPKITVTKSCSLYALPFIDSELYEVQVNKGESIEDELLVLSHEKRNADKEENNKHKYWVKVTIDQKTGYIPCGNLSIDVPETLDLVHKTEVTVEESKKIHCGENKTVAFERWYYPYPDATGIDKPFPRFIQYQDGPCFTLSDMMGIYYNTSYTEYSPHEFLKIYINDFYVWSEDNKCYGGNSRNTVNDKYPPKDGASEEVENMFQCLIDENKKKSPVIIGGNKIGVDKTKDHFVVVVGYLNQGEQRSDFIIVDPYHSFPFPRTIYDFYFINDEGKAVSNSYPFPIAQRSNAYWMGNFASKEEIRDVLKNLLKKHNS